MADSIDAYTSSLSSISDLYSTTTSSSSSLSSTISDTDYSASTDEELMDVCKQFESYFVEQMFKALQDTVPESEESSSSSYSEMFGDTLTEQYASLASESNDGQGLGMAQMLYEQMKRNYDI